MFFFIFKHWRNVRSVNSKIVFTFYWCIKNYFCLKKCWEIFMLCLASVNWIVNQTWLQCEMVNIHLFKYYLSHLSIRVARRLRPITADFRREAGYTLGTLLSYCGANTEINSCHREKPQRKAPVSQPGRTQNPTMPSKCAQSTSRKNFRI